MPQAKSSRMKSDKPVLHWQIVALFALLLLCDTAAQLMFKSGMSSLGEFPTHSLHDMTAFIFSMAVNPMIVLGTLLLLIAFLTWLAIIASLDLSKAHPLTCLSYGTVALASLLFLGEAFTLKQGIGVMMIMLGAYIASEHGA